MGWGGCSTSVDVDMDMDMEQSYARGCVTWTITSSASRSMRRFMAESLCSARFHKEEAGRVEGFSHETSH